MVCGVRHMPPALTGGGALPQLVPRPPGSNGSLLHLLGLSPTQQQWKQPTCLLTSLSTTPIRVLSHTSLLSPVCFSSAGSVHGHAQKWHLQHMMKIVFWFL